MPEKNERTAAQYLSLALVGLVALAVVIKVLFYFAKP